VFDPVREKPFVVSGPRARKLLDVGNTKYWKLVKDGKIRLVNVGKRRMATYASLEALIPKDTD
jgi:hypothetical protein